MACNMYYTNSN